MSGKLYPFCTDQRGDSEVMGTFMSVAITVLLFSIIAAVVLGLGGTNPTASAYVQGDVYPSSNYVVLSHAGGDSIPVNSLQVRVFVNESQAYEPDFTLLTQGYTQDNDGVWSFGDRLLLEQNISAGSTVEVVVVDQRTKNVVGTADLMFREGQAPPTTGSPTTIPTTLTTLTTVAAAATTITATATPNNPDCIDVIEDSVQTTGSNNDSVTFTIDAQPATHINRVTLVWITANGSIYSCDLDQMIIDRSGKDCIIVGMSGCGFMNATLDKDCVLPASGPYPVKLGDFKDADGNPIDMRGSTIALAIEHKCSGSDYFFDSYLLNVPGP